MGDIGRPPSGRVRNGDRGLTSDHHGISHDLDIAGSPCSIWNPGGQAQTQPAAHAPHDGEILRPTDLRLALNSLRERPSDFVTYFCDPSHRRYDGAACRGELKRYLLREAESRPPLQHSVELCCTAKLAARRVTQRSICHSGDLADVVNSAHPGATIAGEMYWLNSRPPESATQVLRDLALDVGVPSRSHRKGLFDPDFTHVGSHIRVLSDGACALFIHFARILDPQFEIPNPVVGMQKADLRKVDPISLTSSDDEMYCEKDIATPSRRPGRNGPPSESREKRNTAHESENRPEAKARISRKRPLKDGGKSGESAPSGIPSNEADAPISDWVSTSRDARDSEKPAYCYDANIEVPIEDQNTRRISVRPVLTLPVEMPGPSAAARSPEPSDSDSAAPQTGRSLMSLIFRTTREFTPPDVFDALYMRSPTSPKSFFIQLCAKVRAESGDAYSITAGVRLSNFTDREKKYIENHPADFDLYVEEHSGYISPTSARAQRSAMRWVLEELRAAGERTIFLNTIRRKKPDIWEEAVDFIERLADCGEI